MNTPSNRDEQLERLVDKVLRDQPLQRAPATLEGKVMAEIARRAVLPWWRNSFGHWPMAARVVFLAASIGFVKLGLNVAAMFVEPLDPAARGAALFAEFSWIHALVGSVGTVIQSVPAQWVYGVVAIVTALYVVLFGVSAAAYRTLYASR